MRILLIILFCTFLFSVSAQNNLNLYSINGEVFKAYAEGKLLDEKAQASILIENITDDTVKIKVEFPNKITGEEILYLLEKSKSIKNTEFDYSVEIKNNKVKFTFEGTKQIIKLPDPIVPKKPIIDTTSKYRNNILGHYCELKDGNPIYFNNSPKTGDCKVHMPNIYISYLNILMSKAQIDDDKYNIAENTTRNNCINAAQLNKILSHIDFEIEKLKLVKLSYFHLTDKNNVKNLDSSFKLESSKKELASFLKNTDEHKIKSGVNCLVASKQSDIDQLLAYLSVSYSDSEKLMVLKKSYSDYCYSVSQVKLVLSPFIHDRERFDAAKLLYFYCVEKDNFLTISDIFSYNSTISDLKEFVGKQKN